VACAAQLTMYIATAVAVLMSLMVSSRWSF
jgi:hypothetical protein